MGMFSRLFWLFEKSKAHKDLQDAYSKLNEIAEFLNKNIEVLRQIQKELVSRRIREAKYSTMPTHALGFEKTLFVEEELIKTLKKLAEITEIKFVEALKKSSKIRPVPKLEREEILRTIAFLEEAKESIPNMDNIEKLSDKDKLQITENALREITSLAKKYYEEETRLRTIIKLKEENISDFLREMYLNPKYHPQQPSRTCIAK